jgi:hypothetical protein
MSASMREGSDVLPEIARIHDVSAKMMSSSDQTTEAAGLSQDAPEKGRAAWTTISWWLVEVWQAQISAWRWRNMALVFSSSKKKRRSRIGFGAKGCCLGVRPRSERLGYTNRCSAVAPETYDGGQLRKTNGTCTIRLQASVA